MSKMIRHLYGTAAIEGDEIVVRNGGMGWMREMRRPVVGSSVGVVEGENGKPSVVITCGNLSPVTLLNCCCSEDVEAFVRDVKGAGRR